MEDREVASAWDAADEGVARLEDVLARLPFDRALPELATLLRLADVPPSLVQQDERARKVLHEAILARPLSEPDEVDLRRTEVEVLLLEVGLLDDVLQDAAEGRASQDALAAALRRLAAIRDRLEELREGL